MERFASFDGVGIAYDVTGAGPDVLLLHGFAADHVVNWVAPGVVDALVADGRRVIAHDARGHGASDKPHDPSAYRDDAMWRDALALLDHLGVTAVDVVGYSMGALVTARLVPGEPRVRSCVLGGIGGRAAAGRGFSTRWRSGVADALEADDLAGIPAAARAFRRFADHTGADRHALAAIQRAGAITAPPEFAAIGVRTLVIAGDRDELAGSPSELAARIPGAVARVVRGTHLGAVADPDFRTAIVDFVGARDGERPS